MCSASRYLLFGWLAGMITASITGSALVGWMAAAAAVGAMYVLGRRYPAQLGGASCAITPRSASDDSADPALPQRAGDGATSSS